LLPPGSSSGRWRTSCPSWRSSSRGTRDGERERCDIE
jgi:hypothetical protein